MRDPDLDQILKDPNAVHHNLLRGALARPSVEQIIHLYGAETLRAVLPSLPDPDERVAELEAVIAEQAALIEGRFSLMRKTGKSAHEHRREAETRADQAERRERALLEANQRERSAVVQLSSLRGRLREAARRAQAEPDRAPEILEAAVRDAGRV
jgi:hypothetical protein